MQAAFGFIDHLGKSGAFGLTTQTPFQFDQICTKWIHECVLTGITRPVLSTKTHRIWKCQTMPNHSWGMSHNDPQRVSQDCIEPYEFIAQSWNPMTAFSNVIISVPAQGQNQVSASKTKLIVLVMETLEQKRLTNCHGSGQLILEM